MIPADIRSRILLLEALANGQKLEALVPGPGTSTQWVGWAGGVEDLLNPRLSFRVKPEPALRPWVEAEVPVGAMIRRKPEPNETFGRHLILLAGSGELWCGPKGDRIGYQRALDNFEWCWPSEYHARDGKPSWNVCGRPL